MVYLKSVLAGMFGVILYAGMWVGYVWFVAVRPFVHQSLGMGAIAGGISIDLRHLLPIMLGGALFFAAGYWWMFRAASKIRVVDARR